MRSKIRMIWVGLALVVGTSSADGQTTSGRLKEDEVWTAEMSPIIITGDVTVPRGVTLTIEPGVVVKFVPLNDDQNSFNDPNRCELRVEGRLYANGTAERPIVFTSNSEEPAPADWYAIRIIGIGTLTYCTIEYAVHGVYSNTDASLLTLNRCIIRHNRDQGAHCWDGWIKITDCTIEKNGCRGIVADHISSGTIQGNTIRGNATDGIFCGVSSPDIIENIIEDNVDDGIECGWSSSPLIKGNIVSANKTHGIFVYGSSHPRIIDNRVIGNGTSGIYLKGFCTSVVRKNLISQNIGYGVRCDGPNNTIFTDNEIFSNGDYGVFCALDASPNFGDLGNTDPDDDGRNQIYENRDYDFRNDSAKDIKAENNWWGTADANSIQKRIYDYNDNRGLGKVDFDPWLMKPPEEELPEYTYDIDRDGDVDVVDIQLVASRWNTQEGDARYTSRMDIDRDGDIDVVDIQLVASHWGEKAPFAQRRISRQVGTVGRVKLKGASEVEVVVNGVENLGAFEVELRYDPEVLRVEGVELGDFLFSINNKVSLLGPKVCDGRILFGGYCYGFDPGVSGEGVLGRLEFRGEGYLELVRVQLVDIEGGLVSSSGTRPKVSLKVEERGDVSIPTEVRLFQNYPNPFNGVTTIIYELPRSGYARLTVYDIRGRKVATLVDRVQSAGKHRAFWDGSVCGGGVYLCKLETDRFVWVRKMLLIK